VVPVLYGIGIREAALSPDLPEDIDIDSGFELAVVVLACTLATLLFASVTMGWLRVRSRLWETVALAAAVALLFRPDFFMDRMVPDFHEVSPSEVVNMAHDASDGGRLVLVIAGMTLEGEDLVKTVSLRLGERPAEGADGRKPGAAPGAPSIPPVLGDKRLTEAGLPLMPLGDQMQITQVRFSSRAGKAGPPS
jgi:hypothetical protein